jgi:hypothetical protein
MARGHKGRKGKGRMKSKPVNTQMQEVFAGGRKKGRGGKRR